MKIITVGKLKESYLKEAVEYYSKIINKKNKLNIIEIDDEKISDKSSIKENEKIKIKEGIKILSKIDKKDYVISLCIDGKQITQSDLENIIKTHKINNEIVFVIGGSLGLSNEVINRSDYKISFGNITYPHQLMRVVLLEQIAYL